MKKLLFVFVTLLVIAGCDKLDKLTIFDVPVETDFTIPSGIPINLPLDIPMQDVETNTSTAFENNNTSADLVEEVKLKKVVLNITSPSGKEFDFVKTVRVFISADGLPEVEIANKYNIDDTIGSELLLDALDVTLTEYAKKDKINLRINTTTDQLLTGNVNVHAKVTLEVNAKILGI